MLVTSDGREIPINHYEVLFGSNPTCSVFVDEPSVKKEHAAIVFKFDMIEPTLL